MIEDLIQRVLGTADTPESEEKKAAAAAAGPSADPAAVAVAMDASRFDAEVARKASEYLDRQSLVADRQLQLLERTLRDFDADRRSASRASRRKRITDLLRIFQQGSVAFIGVAVAVALGYLLVNAMRSHSVVVEQFSAPSSLAPSGLTGDVVAMSVLDELEKLRLATRGQGPAMTAKSAWSSDVKIELPKTGVSIGEIDRLLHQYFSHDLHISGELVQTPADGLSLTVRGDGIEPSSFQGTTGDFEKLCTQAAEYIYGRSQPYRMIIYFIDKKRNKDVLDFAPGALARADDDMLRAQILNGWGSALINVHRHAEAVEKFHLAIALKPLFWAARSNYLLAITGANGEEAGHQAAKEFIDATEAAKPSERPKIGNLQTAAQNVMDVPLLIRAVQQDTEVNQGAGSESQQAESGLANAYAYAHDVVDEQRWILRSPPSATETGYYAAADKMLLAIYSGSPFDPAALLPSAQALWKIWLADPEFQSSEDSACMAAYIFGLNGDQQQAAEVFKRLGQFSRCDALRGTMLEQEGNLAGAEKVWADGIAKEPDLPFTYLARGESRMKRGDLAGAQADFAAAHNASPHFADPLKDWGDALLREGKPKDAFAKYDEALKYAPNWTQLQQAKASVQK